MDTERICKDCGAPLAADSAEGLCPKCLLKVAIGTQPGSQPGSDPGGSAHTRQQPLDPAQLAPYFPQLEILELLGQGGMGAVYKARQPGLDRLVALKLLPPEAGADPGFAERFNREARALARLNHPNIVAVYDFGRVRGHRVVEAHQTKVSSPPQTGELHYFLMEFVDGPNLRQIEQAGKLSSRQALQIIPQICEALQFAHDEGIVHRDIKPENVLLDKKGRVKIADFGLAKILGREPLDQRLTGARDVMGTPHYMAPEQVEHPQQVDHRADIYSLGVVFYEMLTGELPLGRFAAPSERVQVDVRLDEVVLRALEKEPSRRYQHASQVKTDLENISGVLAQLPPHLRQAFGYEYRSPGTLFGLPLVHIVAGTDLETGRPKVAKGVIAIGGRAKGVIAIGGMATGIVACGGLSLGLISIGGLALGLVSVGGLALALVLAYGGGALAFIALGGGAIGYYACGGGAWGVHALGSNGQDPAAQAFFGSWLRPWLNYCVVALVLIPPLLSLLPLAMQRRAMRSSTMPPSQAPASRRTLILWLVALVPLVGLFGFLSWSALRRLPAFPGAADLTARRQIAQEISTTSNGWFPAGSNPKEYLMSLDTNTTHSGTRSVCVQNRIPQPDGFATMLRGFSARAFRGQRVRLSAYLRASKIEDWAGLWMRVDGSKGEVLGFDNMQDRPLKQTSDWRKYEIVLDVPDDSQHITLGLLLSGAGQAWMDDLNFEVVGRDVSTTGNFQK